MTPLVHLKSLKSLNVQFNKLQSLHNSLGALKTLTALNLSSNLLDSIDHVSIDSFSVIALLNRSFSFNISIISDIF